MAETPTRKPRRRGPVRRAVNLTADQRLLDAARALGLNLSQVFESGLAAAVRAAREETWLAENEAAIRAYNEHIDRDGVFGDRFRSF